VFVTSQIGVGNSATGPRLGQGADASPTERSLSHAAASGETIRFLVEAFDRANGRRLWTHELSAEGSVPRTHDKHNLSSSSPATDGQRVYAMFGTGQIVALDISGKPIWTRNLARDFGAFDINWGYSSSPVVYRNTVILVLSTERVLRDCVGYRHGQTSVEGRSAERRVVVQHALDRPGGERRRARRELQRRRRSVEPGER
jgi:outer membrane protein assembly factor BamB